ncbi:MAG: hypothetical protein ACLGI2_10840 [Acidimicrobiia bacterium]
MAATLVACNEGGGERATEVRAVEQAVQAGVDAENTADVERFLDLWTDDGLRSYDAGSRADLESGRSRLGGEQSEIRAFVKTDVVDGRAQSTLDARVEIGLYRMRYDLVRRDGRWLLDGFRFLGPTPPPEGAPVVEVRAVEYAYEVDAAALAAGDVALRFVGAGQEAHELSLFAVPAEVTKAEAVLALSVTTPPDGYRRVGQLAFAAPGDDMTYTLAERLAPGRYAMACFLPVGGIDAFGQPVRADAEPHLVRGMLTDFTVG